ncbi:hypothetical protein [Acinetobacter bereziniae]|uniref:hypothetical protein n=1 Tax=Acinetobacter bereziniae TaxID=106648 RepID=UPI00300BEC80
MNKIALRVFWTNSPMPIQQKVKTPDVVIDVPFGNVLILNTGTGVAPVQSVNTKTGHVVLNAEDVGADQKGSAITVKQQLSQEIQQVKTLAETNQLNLTQKVDLHDFEITQEQVEANRLAILSKADITALSMLATLVNTKADQVYVQEQIANLVNGDQSIINAIQEITKALEENEGLLEALDYTVANRVRFDIATQALTALQKSNARVNIGAEEIGTAALLISKITVQSIGAATAAQGNKADTALQSADVAPVALSGLFNSLNGQNKIFDVVHSAYQIGSNSALLATDTLGQMLGKLQAQINNGSKAEWVRADTIGTFNTSSGFGHGQINGKTVYLEFAKINGCLWIRGFMKIPYGNGLAYTLTDKTYNVLAQNDSTSVILSLLMYFSPSPARLWFRSNIKVNDQQTASNATQTFLIPDNTMDGVYHIPAQCLGVLVI